MTTTGHSNANVALSRFLLPSVRDLIFVCLFASLLAGTLSSRPLADPDIGWHIRTGERILTTHALPRIDTYSSLMQGQPWFAWEWLYDVALGILHRFCGLNGVIWLCALLVATTVTVLLAELLKLGTGLLLSIALTLAAECTAVIHLMARPHIASWLFTLLWFIVLNRWERGERSRWLPGLFPLSFFPLSFFPLSMVLWVNVHAGWILGLALLMIYAFTSAVDSWREPDAFAALRKAQQARKMAWVCATSALATLVNPYGWRLHAHIYRYLSDHYLIDRISEFRSPNFHYWSPRCFAALVVLTMIAFASPGRRIRLSHFLIALLAVYMGLFATRNLPISSMLLVLITGPILWEDFVSFSGSSGPWKWVRAGCAYIAGFSDRMAGEELQLRGHFWPALCVIAALVLCLHGGKIGRWSLIAAHFDDKAVPVAATDFLERERSAEPVFSTDSWGGYLIYRLYPRRQVVVDDRHDLYGPARVGELLTLMDGKSGWEKKLDELRINTIVVPGDSTLAGLLRLLPDQWPRKYEDKVAVVFERRVP